MDSAPSKSKKRVLDTAERPQPVQKVGGHYPAYLVASDLRLMALPPASDR